VNLNTILIDPDFPSIPGQEGAEDKKDYGFHFRMMLRAITLSSLFAIPDTVVVSLLF
jgi:hypothetical protein